VEKHLIARKLFGKTTGMMESPEDRLLVSTTLAYSDDPRMRDLAQRALSPSMNGTSFARIVGDLSLTWRQVEAEYKSLMKSQGAIRQYQHLPDLMEQSAIDARSRMEPCRRCDETGAIFEGKDDDKVSKVCPSCHGEKQVYIPGEVDRLKLVFETFGLIGNFTGEADFLYQREVVAGNPKIYGQLVQILAPYTRVIKPDDASHFLNCQVEHIEIAGSLGLGVFDDKKIQVKRFTL
jgi:hypothetical protein